MAKRLPEIIDVATQQIDELLDRIKSSVSDDDAELVRRIFESYSYVSELVENKNTTIARLRKLMFGSRSERSKDVLKDAEQQLDGNTPVDESPGNNAHAWQPEDDTGSVAPDLTRRRKPGHGRRSSKDYSGAPHVDVAHPTLTAGDACPSCGQGTLYDKPPKVLVRFVGQAPLHACVYRMQKLRCHTCGEIFTASTPREVSEHKYDATVSSMIGLLKYGSGLPFNRIERLQGTCEIPLAASTQWQVVEAASALIAPAYQEILRQAAQGDVVYNDDTTMRILELMGQLAKKNPPDDNGMDPARTGIFTSGVVATCEGRRVALFFSGRQHAGENLRDVLQHRARELDAPIHMCDGLSRNLPRELETILASCLAHGRRNFVELHDRFEAECRHVIQAFKVVYHNDAIAREQGMNPQQRLLHHQLYSKSTMDELKDWMQRQFDDKLVEPNSALGGAINYLLKRWDAMTLFLRKAGAPLDNNVCERALKKAILHRKNSYFYKTRNGARVGDMYMSLIYTCELCQANAFDYLTELQRNAEDVAQHPDQWMPWNYRDTLASRVTPAA